MKVMDISDLIASTNTQASGHDIRLSEADHRIANNLSLIAGFVRLQASTLAKQNQPLSAAEAGQMLEEVGARIETVGRLHQLLSNRPNGGLVDVGDYLKATCDILAQSVCRNTSMALHCDTRTCTIEPEKAGLLGLIVAELVTNAVKYAHPTGVRGRIEVACSRPRGGDLVLSVADDGVGLPEGFDVRVDGGLGMRVVRSLAKQLGAALDFDNGGLGLVVRVVTPRE
jgi:two-component sensor histidine kinase